MDVTRRAFADLVGAYALDACDPDESAAIDAYIAEHPDAAAEVERLRNVAAWLGAVGALNPPDNLRDRVLAAAAGHVARCTPVETLRRETERFETLLDTLTSADLGVVTHNGLTVRDLVAHVAIVDEAFVAGSGSRPSSQIGAEQVEQITGAGLAEIADLSFRQVRDRFRVARHALIDLDAALTATDKVGGYSLGSALVIRAFETWTHCYDIASVLDRAEPTVDPSALRTMAEFGVRTLPLALAAQGYEYVGRTARVVLSGPGGGDWTIACGVSEVVGPVPDVVLRVPAVEFCRRFADRLAVERLPFDIDGDVELGRSLLDAAPAFAGL